MSQILPAQLLAAPEVQTDNTEVQAAPEVQTDNIEVQADNVIVSDPISLQEKLGQGVRNGAKAVYHTVYFMDYMGETLLYKAENVLDGTRLDSIAPTPPEREGYTFVQWSPPETYITGDIATEFTFTAQYESTNLYELNIRYVYENGSSAASPYMATYVYGENYEVPSPTIQGYYIDQINPYVDPSLPISGTAGITQNGATELSYTVTYKASTGTQYSVEHYFQNINDNDYTIDVSLTENLTATTGAQVTVYAEEVTGFTAQTPSQLVTVAPDGSTVVKMYYDRINYRITYDTAGGNFIQPFQGRYGATVPPVTDPTRTGYTFNGWTPSIPTTLTESQTVTAQWTALSNVNYTLVYWLENADPNPDTGIYEYSYHSSATRTGTAGTEYIMPATDKISITYFTFSQYDEGKTIAGDGSTVINIYYTRNSYTIRFYLNRTNAELHINGEIYYNSWILSQLYSITAKYQSDISELWPTVEHIPQVGQYVFSGWRGLTGPTYATKQTVMNEDLINSNGTIKYFYGQWERHNRVVLFDLHYMFESLDGTGTPYNGVNYQEDVALSGFVNGPATSAWEAKTIPGMTSVGVVQDNFVGPDDDYDVYFYYTRNTYNLEFQSHDQLLSDKTKNIKYGASIPSDYYNFTPDTPGALPDHTFGGWYTTSDCTPGTEFVGTNATMPAENLRLFAKWVPPIYFVHFHYTKPDGTIVEHAGQQVYYGQMAVQPEEPDVIPGYYFDGWYYAGTQTRYAFDAQVFSELNLTGRYLPLNDRTYTVNYLFADDSEAAPSKTVTGKTTGTSVTEQAAEVLGYLPDALSKTFTIEAENNVITFYYSRPDSVEYTVRYLDRSTGIALLDPFTGTFLIDPFTGNNENLEVTVEAPSITNRPYQIDDSWVIVDFMPDMSEKTLTLSTNPELNIITFYYEPVIKHHYEVRYLEKGTNTLLSETKHVITAKDEVVEVPKTIANYRPDSVASTYPNEIRSQSSNYISTILKVVDPVNQNAQVITFYYVTDRVNITGAKTWVDQGVSGQRPTFPNVSLTLYANNVEVSPQPVPKWTENGDAWTYEYINLPAATGGSPIRYTVRETVPNNYVASYSDKELPGGTDIINTLDGGTITFSGTKEWIDSKDPVSLYNPRPDMLELTFYRKGHNDTDFVQMEPQPEYTWDKTTGENTWTYTATGLKKYEAGYPVLYKAEEKIPIGYEQTSDDGQNFQNEVIYTTATKEWINGPANNRPTVWFKVYRQVGDNGTPEPAPGASLKELPSGTTEVKWRGLKQTDDNGNPYIFSVQEVDINGNPFTPPNYTKTESGLNVINTYVIPTDGEATVKKIWVNGPEQKPDLYFQLWRKTDGGLMDEGEAVPEVDPINITEKIGYTHTFIGLESTDRQGNPYSFYVKEGQWDGSIFTPLDPTEQIGDFVYQSGAGTTTLTNRYVIPKNGSFKATKVWVDGAQTDKPAIWFQLQRRVIGTETWTPVPDVLPKQIPAFDPDNPTAELSVTWTGLEERDNAAQAYEFSVREGVYNADNQEFTPGSSSPFDMTTGEYTGEIINTYVSPKRDDITVSKVFVSTSEGHTAPVTAVTLELWRQAGTAIAEKVGEVELDGNVDSV